MGPLTHAPEVSELIVRHLVDSQVHARSAVAADAHSALTIFRSIRGLPLNMREHGRNRQAALYLQRHPLSCFSNPNSPQSYS